MANTTVNKQNRFLLITLVVLLAAAAILIAVTGSANKKTEDTPPVDNKTAETSGAVESRNPETEDTIGKLFGKTEQESSAPESEKTAETEKSKPSAAESDEVKEVSAPVTEPLPSFTVPVNGMVSKTHSIDVPVFSCTMNDYRTHTGVDILCEVGTSVVAPADGTIGQVWEEPMMGICLNVIHRGGAVTTFKGLASETLDFITAGTDVVRGQAIAASGSTALIECGDEPHVHMEMTVNGEIVDPAEYIDFEYLSDSFEG
ncbi:MAG: M23 family metallopeptidase [Ruminococcaceae bacterium]|nr:M23 family metallopeptidase [Oscillospiraceae bacterium]